MAVSFVKIFQVDHAKPTKIFDSQTVMGKLKAWLDE